MKFTLLELHIIQDALIGYKYQSNCPKNKIKAIQKKILELEKLHEKFSWESLINLLALNDRATIVLQGS